MLTLVVSSGVFAEEFEGYWTEEAYQALNCSERGMEQEFGKCYDFCYGDIKQDARKSGGNQFEMCTLFGRVLHTPNLSKAKCDIKVGHWSESTNIRVSTTNNSNALHIFEFMAKNSKSTEDYRRFRIEVDTETVKVDMPFSMMDHKWNLNNVLIYEIAESGREFLLSSEGQVLIQSTGDGMGLKKINLIDHSNGQQTIFSCE